MKWDSIIIEINLNSRFRNFLSVIHVILLTTILILMQIIKIQLEKIKININYKL